MTKAITTEHKSPVSEKPDKKRNRYDSPWKRIINRHFRSFMDFFFPEVSQQINWNEKYRFMDKEMQSIQDPVDNSETGDRNADKLVELMLNNGKPANVMIHIEVQDGEQTGFAERMFVYHYRIYDRYRRRAQQNKNAQHPAEVGHSFCEHIISLALLSDINKSWKPSAYQYGLLGCEMNFKFPVAKLMDFNKELSSQELKNPFAVATVAHISYKEAQKQINNAEKTGKSKQDIYRDLFRQKRNLIEALYKAGFERRVVRDLLEFVGLIIKLPHELEKELEIEVLEIENKEEPKVSYLQRFRERGLEEGKKEGKKEGFCNAIKQIISAKFKESGQSLMALIEKIDDEAILEQICRTIAIAQTPEEVLKVIPNSSS
jgi:flagellar biosynthesis/type III secretory pathway protein FliH